MKMYNCSLDNNLIEYIEKLALETGSIFNEILNSIVRLYFIRIKCSDVLYYEESV